MISTFALGRDSCKVQISYIRLLPKGRSQYELETVYRFSRPEVTTDQMEAIKLFPKYKLAVQLLMFAAGIDEFKMRSSVERDDSPAIVGAWDTIKMKELGYDFYSQVILPETKKIPPVKRKVTATDNKPVVSSAKVNAQKSIMSPSKPVPSKPTNIEPGVEKKIVQSEQVPPKLDASIKNFPEAPMQRKKLGAFKLKKSSENRFTDTKALVDQFYS